MGIGTIVAAVLTFMVWSYLLGDNPAFRIAEHVFVGTAVGYAVVVAWYNVVKPAFWAVVDSESPMLAALPLVLCLLLLSKLRPPWSDVGNIAVAFLVGVGAALAVGGALFGTLWPQFWATASLSLNPADYPAEFDETQPLLASAIFWQNLALLIGTIGSFFYFTFNMQPQGPLGGFRETFTRFWSGIGRWIILITLGALFANTVMSRVALLIGRVQWLLGAFGFIG